MRPIAAVAVIVCVVAIAAVPGAAQGSLTGGARVARTYSVILDARFGDVPSFVADTCPPAPTEVCRLLTVVSLWWQIQLDPHDRRQDEAFDRESALVIEAMDTWTRREPSRAEAWFYLGGALGARAQWRALRGSTLAAARDGKRIKAALERALALDPSLQDAYFGIGLYHYYAAVAPAAVRILRWLLLLPGGDRRQGLDEMLRARAGGQLLRSEADYQLHLVYVWYEKQPERALELLEGLIERHPHNPHFLQRMAEIQDHAEAHAASLRSWQTLLERARTGDVGRADMAHTRAELGIGIELDHLGQPEAAIPHLRRVTESTAGAPVGAEALAHLQLGLIYDRLARRDDAIDSYRAALAVNPKSDPLEIDSRARAGLRAPHR